MKKLFVILLLLPACATSQTVKREPMISISGYGVSGARKSTSYIQKKYKKIAVLDFKVQDNSLAAIEIADIVSVQLLRKGYDVPERNHIQSLLKEKYLNYIGVVDAGKLADFKAVSDADAIITGVVGSYDSSVGSSGFAMGNMAASGTTAQSEVSITLKMFDVGTGEVVMAVTGANARKLARGEVARRIIGSMFAYFPPRK